MSKTTTPIPVMVTGVGGGGHGEQILKALRMAETPYEIVGGDMSPYSIGLLEVDHPYLLPPAKDPRYIEALLKVCRKHGVKALFHGSELELKAMSANRQAIRDAGIFLPVNPAAVIELCMNKIRTAETLTEKGFKVPPFRRVTKVEHAETFPHLPAVMKPSLGGGGSVHIYLVQDREALGPCARQQLAIFNDFIIQAYVGTPDQEYTVGVLTDMEGNLINSIGVRRYIMSSLGSLIKVANRTGRAELGPMLGISSGISQGEIGRFPHVTQACERLAVALGARGPINIQCRFVDGEPYVFEINPRFSGTTSLRAMVGYNEPDLLVRKYVLGEEIRPRFPYREGVIMRGLVERLIQGTDFPRACDLA
jgi:carbamoyl-phosphate synthase large subunit